MSNTQHDALSRARQSASTMNYGNIYQGFAEKGITDVRPRENVFTYAAWQALGRQVKKGEHGVSCTTWVPMTKKDGDGNAQPIGRRPRSTTVFHVSQTEPRDGYSEGLWQYALREGVSQERQEQQKAELCANTATAGNTDTADFDVYYSDEFTETARA
jgi:antirestriction protein ArdC